MSRVKTKTRVQRDWRREQREAAAIASIDPREITDVAHFLEWTQGLIVPSGDLIGKPFRLEDWQREWFIEAMRPGIRRAALSCSRKQGKSTMISALELWCLLNIPGFRGIVVSLDAEKSMLLRQNMESIYKASKLEGIKFIGGRTQSGSAYCEFMDSEIKFLPANTMNASQAHAVMLSVIDEAGLLESAKHRRLWDGMVSSMSTYSNAKMLCISVRGHGEMFSELAEEADSPSVYWKEYAGDISKPLDDVENWKLANPGLGTIKSYAAMEDMARSALVNRDVSLEFITFHLNLPQNPNVEQLLTVQEWLENAIVPELPPSVGEVCIGLDLGGSASMTCAALYYPGSMRLDVVGQFPIYPSLKERGRADGVGWLYEHMHSDGELFLAGEKTSDVAAFLTLIATKVGNAQAVIYCDRYRQKELEETMIKLGLNWNIIYRGQGFKDGAEDVRAFRRLVLDGKVKSLRSRMIESAIGEAQVVRDTAGNPKLDKRRMRGRIDAAQAMILALSAGERLLNRGSITWGYVL